MNARLEITAYLSRRADDQIPLLEQTEVCTRLPSQSNNLLTALQVAKSLAPLLDSHIDHLLVRLDADRSLLLTLAPETEKSELCANGLATAGRRANEHIVVGRVQRLEDLGLDLVERLDSRGVDALELLVVQRGKREGLEIK